MLHCPWPMHSPCCTFGRCGRLGSTWLGSIPTLVDTLDPIYMLHSSLDFLAKSQRRLANSSRFSPTMSPAIAMRSAGSIHKSMPLIGAQWCRACSSLSPPYRRTYQESMLCKRRTRLLRIALLDSRHTTHVHTPKPFLPRRLRRSFPHLAMLCQGYTIHRSSPQLHTAHTLCQVGTGKFWCRRSTAARF